MDDLFLSVCSSDHEILAQIGFKVDAADKDLSEILQRSETSPHVARVENTQQGDLAVLWYLCRRATSNSHATLGHKQ